MRGIQPLGAPLCWAHSCFRFCSSYGHGRQGGRHEQGDSRYHKMLPRHAGRAFLGSIKTGTNRRRWL